MGFFSNNQVSNFSEMISTGAQRSRHLSLIIRAVVTAEKRTGSRSTQTENTTTQDLSKFKEVT